MPFLADPGATLDAGSRLAVLGDGAERGVRLIEMRSGGGLELEVVVDRGFDIARLALDGVGIDWRSRTGLRAPWLFDAFDDNGQGFLRGFSGFLATGGHDHIRQPETDPDGHRYPLHGRGAHEPARIVASRTEAGALVAEGEVVQARSDGRALVRHRRVALPLGGTGFEIEDAVLNAGDRNSTLALLYHVNFGRPLVGRGMRLEVPAGRLAWSDPERDPCRPWDAEGGLAAFLVPAAATARLSNPEAGLAVTLGWDGTVMPCLQVLRMAGGGGLSLEPCTTHHRSRAATRAARDEATLAPGEARAFHLHVSVERLDGGPVAARARCAAMSK